MSRKISDIIGELRKRGMMLHVENGELIVSGAVADLPKPLLTEIRASKKELIEQLNRIHKGNSFTLPTKSRIKEDYPTTAAQRRLWLLSQFEKGSAAYNILVRFNLKGHLNVDKLQLCVDELVNKHESLRTVFRIVNGELRQVVSSDIHLPISEHDISEMSPNAQKKFVEQECRRIKNQTFNLENGPLASFHQFKLSLEENVLVICTQHIISDGWSLGLMIRELLVNYGVLNTTGHFISAEATFQYRDYAEWQEENTDLLRFTHADFWKQYIPSEPVYLELPLTYARCATRSNEGNRAKFYLRKDFYDSISQFCGSEGVTLFNFFRATLAILLSKVSGQDTIPIGVPVSGRSNKQVEKTVGMFVNTLPLFSSCKDSIPFIEFLVDTTKDSLQALTHQDYPFDQIIGDLNLSLDRSRNSLFDVMMVFNDAGVFSDVDKIVKAASLEITSTDGWLYDYKDHKIEDIGAQMDLSFVFGVEPGGYFYIDVEYCSKLFDGEFIQSLVHYYKSIIMQVLALPEILLGEIKLMTAEDERLLFEKFNQTQHAFDSNATLTDLFERRVEERPRAVAVLSEEGSMTYEELNEMANKLANYVKSKYEVKPDTPIALKIERGQWMLISVLAILKSGCAYVPISPEFPEERIAYILENSGCTIVLDSQKIDDFKFSQAAYSGRNLGKKHTPENLAYIIYTSGSTGHPKGCMLEHRGIINRLEWMWHELGFDSSDIILQKTTFTFDVSVWELLMPICCGGKMVLCRNEDIISPKLLAELVYKYKVTCMHFVPSALNAFLKFGFELTSPQILLNSLKKIILSGESLTAELVDKWYRSVSVPIDLYNLYGPTEVSIDVTSHKVLGLERVVPIGKPIWNTQIFILNASLQLQPPGIVGEIYLGGIGLARGYMNNSELTSERFLANPFFKGKKIYKTGDIGRWLPDGNIEFMGRKDDQVKIRGHRIELGEIERVLISHTDIKEAAVIVRKNTNEENEISAFVVGARDFTVSELREYLGIKLPSFMLPENYIQLDSLPLNKNGKIDKRALKNSSFNNIRTGVEFAEPNTEVERNLIRIWRGILKQEQIGVHDNFFDLGGNSLKVLKVVEKINKSLGVDVPVVKVFQFPTVSLLAEFINSGRTELLNKETEEMRSRSVDVMEQTLNLIKSSCDD